MGDEVAGDASNDGPLPPYSSGAYRLPGDNSKSDWVARLDMEDATMSLRRRLAKKIRSDKPDLMFLPGQPAIVNAGVKLEVQAHDWEHNKTVQGKITNVVQTSKYTWLNFVPKNLFEQFHRPANFFFFLVACLQVYTDYSPTGKYTTVIPLGLTMSAVGLKNLLEDRERRKNDEKVNSRVYSVLRGGEWARLPCVEIRVGDIVRVEPSEEVPADGVLLSTDKRDRGIAYVHTSNIDGETDLKTKTAVPITSSLHDPKHFSSTRITAVIKPNNNVITGANSFSGSLRVLFSGEEKPSRFRLTHDQFLLRGSQLCNTRFAYFFVLYIGSNTKMVLNSRSPPSKISTLEQRLNKYLLLSFLLLVGFCSAGTGANKTWADDHASKTWYVHVSVDDTWRGIFTTFLLLMNPVIPMSLYMSLELVRAFITQFINYDNDMFHKESVRYAQARTLDLCDDLGQVKYLFTDKTGTLTQNVMRVAKVSLYGTVYSRANPSSDGARKGKRKSSRHRRRFKTNEEVPYLVYKQLCLLQSQGRGGTEARNAVHLATNMLCNSSVVPDDSGATRKFVATAPDERALMEFCETMGMTLRSRQPDKIRLHNEYRKQSFYLDIIFALDFTAERKRSSIVIRDEEGRLVLYCKGSDEELYRMTTKEARRTEWPITHKHVKRFARHGHRVLAFTMRYLSEDKFNDWKSRYTTASSMLNGKDAVIQSLENELESEMHLLGVTAIEDKLQHGVPETISVLQRANIKIWTLTGDKMETARKMAHTCSLIYGDMAILKVAGETAADAATNLKRVVLDYKALDAEQQTRSALLISGETLRYILEDPELRTLFYNLSIRQMTVIACRVSPMQKAELVRLVRLNDTNVVTLAIGDGSNDVSMLRAAHVGVGLYGAEGRQAVMSSDYSISQFRYLRSLLLVHGALSYRRVANVALFCFYKSSVLYFAPFWFAAFNLWSASSWYEKWAAAGFNLFFSSAPIFAYGCFDRHLDAETLKRVPELYRTGHSHGRFSTRVYVKWMVRGIYHSFVCFYVPVCVFNIDWGQTGIVATDGLDRSLYVMGMYAYTLVVVTVTVRSIFVQRTMLFANKLAIIGTILMWFVGMRLYSNGNLMGNEYVAASLAQRTFDHFSFWLSIPLGVFVAVAPELAFDLWQRMYHPAAEDVALEIQELKLIKSLRAAQRGKAEGMLELAEANQKGLQNNEMGTDQQIENEIGEDAMDNDGLSFLGDDVDSLGGRGGADPFDEDRSGDQQEQAGEASSEPANPEGIPSDELSRVQEELTDAEAGGGEGEDLESHGSNRRGEYSAAVGRDNEGDVRGTRATTPVSEARSIGGSSFSVFSSSITESTASSSVSVYSDVSGRSASAGGVSAGNDVSYSDDEQEDYNDDDLSEYNSSMEDETLFSDDDYEDSDDDRGDGSLGAAKGG